MEFIADLHIHSRYSRATSQAMEIPQIAQSAQLKGIKLVATGDFTHPGWIRMLKEHLIPSNSGLFQYGDTHFILSSEVNNTYTYKGRLRRIHNIIYTPSFEDAERINHFLGRYGNLVADGRPTLTLNSKEMLSGILEIAPDSCLVPAHIWTPWFSLFGANSGFDSIEECFGDLKTQIPALETGLSSDPPMNWRLSALDPYTLISNSDAHSPARLGREANLFNCEFSYYEILDVLRHKDSKRLLCTLEFFPEEGKYHYDGHRRCQVRLAPKEAMLNNDICPGCGRHLTVGVLHRVELLSDRPEGYIPENAIPYRHLIPLEEIIAEALGTGRDTAGVHTRYLSLVKVLKGEFHVLLYAPIEEIEHYSDERIALGVERMRQGQVQIKPGYDGLFGEIKLFGPAEPAQEPKHPAQLGLF
jgi:uncharacterized protein (TIGR00375 family)